MKTESSEEDVEGKWKVCVLKCAVLKVKEFSKIVCTGRRGGDGGAGHVSRGWKYFEGVKQEWENEWFIWGNVWILISFYWTSIWKGTLCGNTMYGAGNERIKNPLNKSGENERSLRYLFRAQEYFAKSFSCCNCELIEILMEKVCRKILDLILNFSLTADEPPMPCCSRGKSFRIKFLSPQISRFLLCLSLFKTNFPSFLFNTHFFFAQRIFTHWN